jgi:hypothetical protein
MAKKSGGPNKSASIREYLSANPAAKPREIVEALAAQGVVVTPMFVSTIKSKAVAEGEIKVTKRRGRPKGTAKGPVTRKSAAKATPRVTKRAVAAGESVSVEGLVTAKELVAKLGGFDKARAVLAALEKITG